MTAGVSSPLTDGASAVLVCSERYAREKGLDIMARIRSAAVSGCSPEIMGMGPVASTNKALQRAGLTLEDMDVIEINEAFAAQTLAVVKEWGLTRAGSTWTGSRRPRPPAGSQRCPHHRQGSLTPAARGRPLRPGYDVYRRRSGDRHRPGGDLVERLCGIA